MKRIALKNFFRNPNGDCNLYEQDLGWCQRDHDEAMASDPYDVLKYHLEFGYDMYFFDTKTLRWYYIDTCSSPEKILVRMKPRKDWDGQYIEDNIEPYDMDDEDLEVLFKCRTADEFLKGAAVGGDPISEVITRSFINFS